MRLAIKYTARTIVWGALGLVGVTAVYASVWVWWLMWY